MPLGFRYGIFSFLHYRLTVDAIFLLLGCFPIPTFFVIAFSVYTAFLNSSHFDILILPVRRVG
jgi:hypothetical protein